RKSVSTRPGCCVLSLKLVSIVPAGCNRAGRLVALVAAGPTPKSSQNANPVMISRLCLSIVSLLLLKNDACDLGSAPATYGVTVTSGLTEMPAREAKAAAKSTKIPTSVGAVTGCVVIGKVPELAPAGMLRLAGT